MTAKQTEKARADQVVNSAGGFVFKLDKWARLDRWLVLGSEGGTYYASERALTRDNAQTILECLAEDGPKTVRRIAEISVAGRAPKNDPAIFALALAAADPVAATREAAFAALPRVCRIGTHLFHFARDVQNFRGWGRGLRHAAASWYLDKSVDKLSYDLLKYQSRDGWSHRDLLRLAHPNGGIDPIKGAAFKWATSGTSDKHTPSFLAAYEELKLSNVKQAVSLIQTHGFTHEMIPSELKNEPDVWRALLYKMPTTALVRNLGKMTKVGILEPLSAHAKLAKDLLTDQVALKRSKIHPLQLLMALKTYEQGHGEKGKLVWTPNPQIVDALNEAFYLSFDNIEPTGKNTLLALDVSGSMEMGEIAGMAGITPGIGAAAMAMATARVEENWACVGFSHGLVNIPFTSKTPLNRLVDEMRRIPFGRTDCALPMLSALENKAEVDTFVIYTDNETWSGGTHPWVALENYRQKMGRPAKLVVVGMTATGFTIADPNDAGMMDVVGFDSSAPALISDFARG